MTGGRTGDGGERGERPGRPKRSRKAAPSGNAARGGEPRDEETYVLRLYVAGMTPNSVLAIENIRRICEEHLRGRYELDVVDVFQQPEMAEEQQIVAAPTLIKKLPLPLRKFIGTMADEAKILVGLDLRPRQEPRP